MAGQSKRDDAASPLSRLGSGEPDDLFDNRDEPPGPGRKPQEPPYGGDDDLYGASAAVSGIEETDDRS
ncbi:hypothetical protein [Kitasatospora sp. NPDC093558]|uniref:hypothetical protein n=1 Tax=Kitasatospora sp. NPDC093558 TaxID=3155201 RepID=UPI003416CBA8